MTNGSGLLQPFPLVALCGAPGSGKSEVQQILGRTFGCVSIDDGGILREACKALYGFSDDQVKTQEGKASLVEIAGRTVAVRDPIGWIGQHVEEKFGPDFIPLRAIEKARADHAHHDPMPTFVFGSVRREQGHVYRSRNGLVIEIVRPGKSCINDFDHYNPVHATHMIDNDGDLESLRERTLALFRDIGFSAIID